MCLLLWVIFNSLIPTHGVVLFFPPAWGGGPSPSSLDSDSLLFSLIFEHLSDAFSLPLSLTFHQAHPLSIYVETTYAYPLKIYQKPKKKKKKYTRNH